MLILVFFLYKLSLHQGRRRGSDEFGCGCGSQQHRVGLQHCWWLQGAGAAAGGTGGDAPLQVLGGATGVCQPPMDA